MTSPPLYNKDAEHLRLLAIFHYVLAGLAVLGIGFLCVHFLFMKLVLTNPEFTRGMQNARPMPFQPAQFFSIFQWFYLFMGLLLVLAAAFNVLSAVYLGRRRHRTFSLVVAGLDCLQIPFGTALGICAILVLSRDSVRQLYESQSG
jgi:hypothetical protein